MGEIEEVTQLLQPILDDCNAELVDIRLSGSKQKPILRILVDKKRRLPADRQGITLGECSDINRQLGETLDKDPIIKESYILEVSSPGLDRPLRERRDFEKIIGKTINLYIREAIDGKNFFYARLNSTDEESISIETKDGRLIKIPYENINKANLEIKF